MHISTNPVRQALLDRTVSLGSWVQIGHPAAAEVLATAGFDWVAVDCEHTEIGIDTFGAVVRGLHGRGSVPFVRVRENDTLAIRQVLDLGARGVIVPLVSSGAEAEAAVQAAKYPPRGVRGYAFCRANDHGAHFDDYVRNANDDTAVVVMIESRQAVEHIDDILQVEGVDGIFVGPYDLSGSYGLPGQLDAPPMKDAFDKVLAACRRHGKAAGLHVVKPTAEAIERAVRAGFTFLALGIDTIFIDQGARQALQVARGA
ncbi:MAG: 2,4-dihydroxyhept-2-ene-1,7-dioic acid aldolase [Lentisphaerae bacterium]|nr:2,4-dihydroxyhept-2-ene-1,7-dioic acid aldolase [Lentisphaerota bacterium]